MSLLEDLPTGPISKIAAGGYVLAALTSGRDLYYWGCYPGRPAMLNDVSADPTPAEVEDKDIVDVGVGDLHMIVLTADGQVFVIGDNGNGQIALVGRSPGQRRGRGWKCLSRSTRWSLGSRRAREAPSYWLGNEISISTAIPFLCLYAFYDTKYKSCRTLVS